MHLLAEFLHLEIAEKFDGEIRSAVGQIDAAREISQFTHWLLSTFMLHNNHARNMKFVRWLSMGTDICGGSMLEIHGYLVTLSGIQLSDREFSGIQDMQWQFGSVLHEGSGGRRHLGRTSGMSGNFVSSQGLVFSSKRAVPSTSLCHPLHNRSLINITPRLCLHSAYSISTDCAHCCCFLSGCSALGMMMSFVLNTYIASLTVLLGTVWAGLYVCWAGEIHNMLTIMISYVRLLSAHRLMKMIMMMIMMMAIDVIVLLYHTYIASPTVPLGSVCVVLCIWCAGGIHNIFMTMILCLWLLIAHDLMTIPYTTPSYAVMWLVMIVLPSLLGGCCRDLTFGMEPMWYNSFVGGWVQLFLGGLVQLPPGWSGTALLVWIGTTPFWVVCHSFSWVDRYNFSWAVWYSLSWVDWYNSFLDGSVQLFLGCLVQQFYGGPFQFVLGGQSQFTGVLHYLLILEDARSKTRSPTGKVDCGINAEQHRSHVR